MEWSKIKEMTEAIKNICLLILYLVIVVFFFVFIWPNRSDFEVKKIAAGPIEIGPKEKQALKTLEAVSNNVPLEAKDTAKITPRLYAAAKLVDSTLNINNQNWVYIGQIVNGKLTNTHFKIKEIPQIGDMIAARDAVYKRKDLPIELANGNWKLGDIKGVVGDDESVKVNAVKEIQGKNFWALVQ